MAEPPPNDRRSIVGRLYDQHGASVYRYALMLLADPAAAEDAVQQVFTALLRPAAPIAFDHEAHYLRRAVRNECFSTLRRRRVRDEDATRSLLEAGLGRSPEHGQPQRAGRLYMAAAVLAANEDYAVFPLVSAIREWLSGAVAAPPADAGERLQALIAGSSEALALADEAGMLTFQGFPAGTAYNYRTADLYSLSRLMAASLPQAPSLYLLPARSTTETVMRPWITGQTVCTLRVWAELVEAARTPWPGRIDVAAAMAAKYGGEQREMTSAPVGPLAAIRRAAMYQRLGAYETFSRIARPDDLVSHRASVAAIAVERHRRDHKGALPGALTDLVPQYLAAVPQDPVTGGPLLQAGRCRLHNLQCRP